MLIPPLCEQLIGHCAAHQAVRVGGSSGLGRLCLARRPSQASFSYTIALSGIGGKTTHFCQLSLPASARTSKGCREGDASSISKLQRQRPEQKYSLIVTYDLYIYMSWASIHWRLVVILDLRDCGNIGGVQASWEETEATVSFPLQLVMVRPNQKILYVAFYRYIYNQMPHYVFFISILRTN